MRLRKILFVCGKNTVYSPTCEAILKRLVKNNGYDNFINVDSAGIDVWPEGEFPRLDMMKTAADKGFLLTHRTRKFHAGDIEKNDYVFVIGKNNYDTLYGRLSNESDQIKVFPIEDFTDKFETTCYKNEFNSVSDINIVLDMLIDVCQGIWEYVSSEMQHYSH